MVKQNGGSLSVRTYALVLLVAAAFAAGFYYNRWSQRPVELPTWEVELYQLTPQEWKDEAYTVTIEPEEAGVCNSFVERSVCYIRL